jgi:hypothetical protein
LQHPPILAALSTRTATAAATKIIPIIIFSFFYFIWGLLSDVATILASGAVAIGAAHDGE